MKILFAAENTHNIGHAVGIVMLRELENNVLAGSDDPAGSLGRRVAVGRTAAAAGRNKVEVERKIAFFELHIFDIVKIGAVFGVGKYRSAASGVFNIHLAGNALEYAHPDFVFSAIQQFHRHSEAVAVFASGIPFFRSAESQFKFAVVIQSCFAAEVEHRIFQTVHIVSGYLAGRIFNFVAGGLEFIQCNGFFKCFADDEIFAVERDLERITLHDLEHIFLFGRCIGHYTAAVGLQKYPDIGDGTGSLAVVELYNKAVVFTGTQQTRYIVNIQTVAALFTVFAVHEPGGIPLVKLGVWAVVHLQNRHDSFIVFAVDFKLKTEHRHVGVNIRDRRSFEIHQFTGGNFSAFELDIPVRIEFRLDDSLSFRSFFCRRKHCSYHAEG